MQQRTCERCSEQLTGRQRRYCSRLCTARQARAEGRWTRVPQKPVDLTCARCGTKYEGFKPKADDEHKRTYCSPECQANAKAWRYRARFSSPLDWRDCNECGAAFISHRSRTRCNDCHIEKQRRWVGGPCAECGTNFIGRWHPEWPCRYCSNKCIRRVGRRLYRAKHGRLDGRKRARYYGVPYEPISRTKVFERDGYRCLLCGTQTRPSARVPEPLAPTVDHIVPMSKGGPHLYANVQCACFRCNTLKGDGAANDQLRLLG